MPLTATEHTGDRIARYRKLRHLTQQALAETAGVSYSMLTKIEQGVRPVSPAVLAAIARALSVQTVDLTGQPYLAELQADELDGLIQPIRDALDLYDLGTDPEIAPRGIAALSAEADQLCALMRDSQIKATARALPALITEATTVAHATQATEAWQVLASTYRTAYDVTTKLGFADLCVVALDRMAWAADRAADPVLAAVRQYLRSLTYLRAGQYTTGTRLIALGMATLGQADPGRTRDVVTGQLHLSAAVLAARSLNGDTAAGHIAEASRIAETTGEATRVHWLSFGPTNVTAHQIETLAELYQYAEALQTAGSLTIPDKWPASRVAAHLAEVARAQLWTGRTDQAQQTLQRAREVAPQQTRYQPMVRETVAGLLSARRATPGTLVNLAHWVGI